VAHHIFHLEEVARGKYETECHWYRTDKIFYLRRRRLN